jgi:hypothetical protein
MDPKTKQESLWLMPQPGEKLASTSLEKINHVCIQIVGIYFEHPRHESPTFLKNIC